MTATATESPFKAKASNKGGTFDQCPAGNWPGMLLCLIDLGTHWDKYRDQKEKKVRKLYLVFEVEAEVEGKGDQRFWLGKDFNVGLDDKGALLIGAKSNLRQLLEGWRGKPYADGEEIDIQAVHKQPCLVNVIHEQAGERSYARVKSVAKVPKGMTLIKPTKSAILYAANTDAEAPGHGDDEKSEWLPRIYGEKVEEVLERCLEWNGTGRKESKAGEGQESGRGRAATEDGDEIPF
ncbi:MAG: hypothetical protein K2R98_28330 [Gemmataceae bacterium]|nr:hypothetical protein [Gemmataceae bacterium]